MRLNITNNLQFNVLQPLHAATNEHQCQWCVPYIGITHEHHQSMYTMCYTHDKSLKYLMFLSDGSKSLYNNFELWS